MTPKEIEAQHPASSERFECGVTERLPS